MTPEKYKIIQIGTHPETGEKRVEAIEIKSGKVVGRGVGFSIDPKTGDLVRPVLHAKSLLLPWAIHTNTIKIHGPFVRTTPTKKPDYNKNPFLKNLLRIHGWNDPIEGIPLGTNFDSFSLIYEDEPRDFYIPTTVQVLQAGFSFRAGHVPSKESPLFPDLKMENEVPLEIVGVVILSIDRQGNGMTITVMPWPITTTAIQRKFIEEVPHAIGGRLQEKIKKRLAEDFRPRQPHGRLKMPGQIQRDALTRYVSKLSKKHRKPDQTIIYRNKKTGAINEIRSKLWEKRGLRYVITAADFTEHLSIFKDSAPSVGANQSKNVIALSHITIKQQEHKPERDRRAKAEFTFKQYAEIRGYFKNKLHGAGRWINDLKLDLYSGVITRFQGPDDEYPLGNLYNIKPLQNGLLSLGWSHDYDMAIEEAMKGGKRRKDNFYLYSPEEIRDHETTRRPKLHFFYRAITLLRFKAMTTSLIRIEKFLTKYMGITNLRPDNVAQTLRECFSYFANQEQYNDEIGTLRIKKSLYGTDTIRLSLNDLKAWDRATNQEIEKIILETGVSHIKDALIRIGPAPKHLVSKPERPLDDYLETIIDEIMFWLKDNEYRDEKEAQEVVYAYVRLTGDDMVQTFFEEELGSKKPDPGRLISTLEKEVNRLGRQKIPSSS